MILLAVLRDLVTDADFKASIQAKIMQPKNLVDGIPEKVRVEVRDRPTFNDHVVKDKGTLAPPATGLQEPARRYITALGIFKSKLQGMSQDNLQAITTFLSTKCVIIRLATPSFDDAFALFSIVNDRGKQLRRIDVLKAINIAPDVVASPSVRSRLAQEWEEIEGALGESRFESVFHLLRLALLKDKPQGDLLKEFEERVFPKATVAKGEPFMQLVFAYARLYLSIFVDRYFVTGEPKTQNRYRALIHIMDVEFQASEWRACLLHFARKFGQDQFYRFCLAIEKVYLGHWVKAVRKDERYGEYAKILGAIDSAKKAEEVFAQIKSDPAAIQSAARQKDLYSVGFGKYFLLRLEVVTIEHDSLHEFGAASVEHVLPQTPAAGSRWLKEHALKDMPEYVDSIGNLVLLSRSKNSSAKNYEFEDKKTKYLQPRVSDYPRSMQVLGETAWTRATIDKRTAGAADLILQDP